MKSKHIFLGVSITILLIITGIIIDFFILLKIFSAITLLTSLITQASDLTDAMFYHVRKDIFRLELLLILNILGIFMISELSILGFLALFIALSIYPTYRCLEHIEENNKPLKELKLIFIQGIKEYLK